MRFFRPNPRIPYDEVVRRLKSVSWGRLTQLGRVSDYPIFTWQHSPRRAVGSVCISTGIHGDEPSGVMALLGLLEARPSWMEKFECVLFPCLNPWGYEHNVRYDKKGFDLNRQWRKDETPEVGMARRVLKGRRFQLAICLHEDYDANGFYLYELSRNGVFFGSHIVRTISRFLPTDSRTRIENRLARQGVVSRPVESMLQRKRWPETFYHLANHTDHTLTMETPTHYPIEKRVRAHAEAVRKAFSFLKRSS